MECLLFLWWNFALYLACYDGTCYLDETLHCNMYMDGTCLGMNHVYGWNLCDMWYVIWNLCARYVLDMCWIWNLYMWYVLQIVGFNKKQKKQTICRLFAVCHRRQWALCRQPRTAKGSGKEGYGKQLLCRLLPGGGRQRGRMTIIALSVR